MGNKGSIGTKGPPINTAQGKISGDKGSTGNKGSIGVTEPSFNTDQGTFSGGKGSTGNTSSIDEKKDGHQYRAR